MAGAKRPTTRRTKRRRSPAPPTSTSIRSVRSSNALDVREASAHLGIDPSTLRRWAQTGLITASIDDRGRYHFPWRSVLAASLRLPVELRRSAKRKLLTQKKRKTGSGKKALLRLKPEARRPKPPSSPLRKKRRVSASAATSAPAASAATSANPRRKKRFAKKPRPSAKKSKTVQSRRKKAKATGTGGGRGFIPIRRVSSSAAPTLAEAAETFGVAPATLLDWIRLGRVRGYIDSIGVIHVPAAELQARNLAARAKKKRGKKKLPSRRPSKKKPKKRPGKKKPGKKKRAKKKVPPWRMDMDKAAKQVGESMRDYIMARFAWEREATHLDFYGQKQSFRSAYGNRQWRRTFEWIVDEWGLEDYIFAREALRDS